MSLFDRWLRQGGSDHYKGGELEPIDVIEAWGWDFWRGNILKYLRRWDKKGESEKDVIKVLWYMLDWIQVKIREGKLNFSDSEIDKFRDMARLLNGIGESLKEWNEGEKSDKRDDVFYDSLTGAYYKVFTPGIGDGE